MRPSKPLHAPNRPGSAVAAVDNQQIHGLRLDRDPVDLAPLLEIDEVRIRLETLERGVLVVAVDGATGDAAILEIPDEVRSEEALADAAFALMTRLICLAMNLLRRS
jgi:hypothetical protein